MSMISDKTKIILGLANYFDYAEYSRRCSEVGITPEPRGLYYQTAGMLEGAKQENPDDIIGQYLAIVEEMNQAYITNPPARPIIGLPNKKEKNCGGCGGGKVR